MQSLRLDLHAFRLTSCSLHVLIPFGRALLNAKLQTRIVYVIDC
ncbi:hypothetical protein OROMI_030576 [Orobanche minor]